MHQKKGDTFARYLHIVGKLQRTIIVNHQKFSELTNLHDQVICIPLDKTQTNPYLHHLEQISRVLKQNSHTYIVRHLYYNFSKDVDALIEDRELLVLEYYLNYAD